MSKRRILFALILAAAVARPVYLAGQATVSILAQGTQAIKNGALLIPDSYVKVGRTADPNTALAPGGLFLTGTLEADGAVRFDGPVTFNGGSTSGTISLASGGVIAPDPNGPMSIGDGNTTVITMTTESPGDSSIVMTSNSIGPDEVGVYIDSAIFCGELAENGTTYLGPSLGALGGNGADLSIGSTACDALDNVTEATADAPLFTLITIKPMGMYCKTDGTLGASETLVYTLRSAAADAGPPITCTITTGQQECRSLDSVSTNLALGATVAVKAVETSNNADDNGWCRVTFAVK